MKSTIHLLLGSAVVALAMSASAGDPRAVEAQKDQSKLAEPQKGMWLLSKYDNNGDHVISTSEVAYKREKMFGFMDSDQDGIVSFDEYQGLDIRKRELLLKARFQKLDFDHDGHLSAAEYGSYLGSFERFDSNGDGKLTAAEIAVKKSTPEPTKVAAKTRCLLWLCVRSSLD